jgi:transposase
MIGYRSAGEGRPELRPIKLRRLSSGEHDTLQAKLANKSVPARIHQRYRVIAELAVGHGTAEVADRVGCSAAAVYHWAHAFEQSGFTSFERPNNPRGPIPIVDGGQVLALIKVALARPEELGLPFSHWSVKKLTAYCREHDLLPPITDEWVRRLLHREGVSFQHTKTWKESPDPQFELKKTVFSTSTTLHRSEGP